MTEADEIKEEIGWLKLIFAALIAIEVLLIAWLAQNYTRAGTLTLIGAFLTIVAAGVGIAWINRAAYGRIRQLRNM